MYVNCNYFFDKLGLFNRSCHVNFVSQNNSLSIYYMLDYSMSARKFVEDVFIDLW